MGKVSWRSLRYSDGSLPLLFMYSKARFQRKCKVAVFVTTDVPWGIMITMRWYDVELPEMYLTPLEITPWTKMVPWSAPGFRELKGDFKRSIYISSYCKVKHWSKLTIPNSLAEIDILQKRKVISKTCSTMAFWTHFHLCQSHENLISNEAVDTKKR